VKRALISVSDKRGVVDFAKELAALEVEIVSTGGTRKTLAEAGIPVVHISEVTGFPEILDGRVKTLHPAIHGGILARRSDPAHVRTLAEQHIAPIDLVAVNLYPFRQTAARPGVSWDELIENIDIGGPSMVRSAAKNHEDVLVVVSPEDYDGVLAWLRTEGDCPPEERKRLAAAAFRHTADYDACIADTLTPAATGNAPEAAAAPFPPRLTLAAEKAADLRYGENPEQAAALYRLSGPDARNSFIDAAQLQGKALSYNNWLDADSAFRAVQDLHRAFPGDAAAVIVKHSNPCGAAIGETVEAAFEKAYMSDPVSAFGGIAAFSRPVTVTATKNLVQRLREIFWEVVIAPAYSPEALEILSAKTNLRLLEVSMDAGGAEELEWRSVSGGLLAQERDARDNPPESWKTVTAARKPSEAERRDLFFAWKVVKHVKSNAIVLAKDGATVGVGAGQMNRVGAAEIALRQAGEKARGAALASDAFFPFADTVRLAAAHGVAAIIQPGGSLRDQESIDAADEAGMTMLHTGVRHFKH
jgi:phosphoribosylaminoimidazolecarboxamide formyltransferase/IMP cyclohydrolase